MLRVYVEDNQHVNRGDLLAEVDPRDLQARAAEARARLSDISARAQGAQSNLALTSTVTSAVLTQAGAAADAARAMARSGSTPRERLSGAGPRLPGRLRMQAM